MKHGGDFRRVFTSIYGTDLVHRVTRDKNVSDNHMIRGPHERELREPATVSEIQFAKEIQQTGYFHAGFAN